MVYLDRHNGALSVMVKPVICHCHAFLRRLSVWNRIHVVGDNLLRILSGIMFAAAKTLSLPPDNVATAPFSKGCRRFASFLPPSFIGVTYWYSGHPDLGAPKIKHSDFRVVETTRHVCTKNCRAGHWLTQSVSIISA